MDNFFPDENSKLELAISASKTAKAIVLDEEGIGSDIRYVLLGWKGPKLMATANLAAPLMENEQVKFEFLIRAAVAMRRGFGAEALTWCSDGFAVRKGEATDLSAAERWAAGDPDVSEALLITHVDKWEPVVTCVMVPYHVGLGRTVEWFDTYRTPLGFEGAYPHALSTTLNLEPIPEPNIVELVHAAAQFGVTVQAVAP
jgi:hypothetical protein